MRRSIPLLILAAFALTIWIAAVSTGPSGSGGSPATNSAIAILSGIGSNTTLRGAVTATNLSDFSGSNRIAFGPSGANFMHIYGSNGSNRIDIASQTIKLNNAAGSQALNVAADGTLGVFSSANFFAGAQLFLGAGLQLGATNTAGETNIVLDWLGPSAVYSQPSNTATISFVNKPAASSFGQTLHLSVWSTSSTAGLVWTGIDPRGAAPGFVPGMTNIYDIYSDGTNFFVGAWQDPTLVTAPAAPTTGIPGGARLTLDLFGRPFWQTKGFIDDFDIENGGTFTHAGGHIGASTSVGCNFDFVDTTPLYLSVPFTTAHGFLRCKATNWNNQTLGDYNVLANGAGQISTNYMLGTNSFMDTKIFFESPVDGTMTNTGWCLGFGTSWSTGSGQNLLAAQTAFAGWVFRGNTNGSLQICTKNASGTTITNAAVTLTTNATYWLGCQINTNLGQAVFLTNGVPFITNYATIPVGLGLVPGFCWGLLGTNTAYTFGTNYAWLDFINHNQ